tara:strand:- start:626 stop:1321 length:696 start_codon:yes stop_codon:yes gene_type:complete
MLLLPSLICAQNIGGVNNIKSKRLAFSFQCGAIIYSGNTFLEHKKFSREGFFGSLNFFTKKQLTQQASIISKSSFCISNAIAKELNVIIPESEVYFTTKIPNILAFNINYTITLNKQINNFLDHGLSLKFRVVPLFYKKGQIFNTQLHSLGGFISAEDSGSLPDLEKATQISYTINYWLREETSMNVSFFLNSDWKITNLNTHQIYPGVAIKFEKTLNRNFHPPWIRRVNK